MRRWMRGESPSKAKTKQFRFGQNVSDGCHVVLVGISYHQLIRVERGECFLNVTAQSPTWAGSVMTHDGTPILAIANR